MRSIFRAQPAEHVRRIGLTPLAMFKRILFCSALALSCPMVLAADGPAWGLIVKLKGETSTTQSSGSNVPYAIAQAVHGVRAELSEAQGQAQLHTALQRAGLPQAGHRALIGTSVHHVAIEQMLTHAQAQTLAQKLMASGAVEWAVPNEREHLQQSTSPNDPYFSDQWWADYYSSFDTNHTRGVPDIRTAWQTTNGSITPVIAILDTGITSHPDLYAGVQILQGYDFVSNATRSGDGTARDNDPSDPGDGLTSGEIAGNPSTYTGCTAAPSSWHGTAVTGVIASHANNSQGIVGANWAARILPVRVAGKCGAWESDIIDGMRWAAGRLSIGGQTNPNPARIVNLSFGGSGACTQAYADVIAELRSVGVVVVAAAGNEHGSVSRPANCPGAVAVAALNRDGFKANYSNFGPEIIISTVGGDPGYIDNPPTQPAGSWGPYLGDSGILTLGNGGTYAPGVPGYYYYSGTSLAAPVTSAVLSLMLSVNATLTVDQLIQGLRASARPHVQSPYINNCSASNPGRCICTTSTCGSGILDANRALQYAVNPGGYAASNLTPDVINNTTVQAAAATGQDTVLAVKASATGPTENNGGGGGGGAFSLIALAGLAAAAALAGRRVRARPAPPRTV